MAMTLAVAAVEKRRGRDIFPQFNQQDFLNRCELLHDALKTDRDKLLKQYKNEIGEENFP